MEMKWRKSERALTKCVGRKKKCFQWKKATNQKYSKQLIELWIMCATVFRMHFCRWNNKFILSFFEFSLTLDSCRLRWLIELYFSSTNKCNIYEFKNVHTFIAFDINCMQMSATCLNQCFFSYPLVCRKPLQIRNYDNFIAKAYVLSNAK